jgi:hypothetical protein
MSDRFARPHDTTSGANCHIRSAIRSGGKSDINIDAKGHFRTRALQQKMSSNRSPRWKRNPVSELVSSRPIISNAPDAATLLVMKVV